MVLAAGTILGGASLAMGLGSALFGSRSARKARRRQEQLLREQKARNNAWYSRNYNEDYLNTVGAQAAIKRVRDAWDKKTQEARARQAVSGGTAEQATAVAEAGGEAMANAIGNIAAQGERNRQQVDAQKASMDANVSAQEAAIADAEQQAGMNLMENGIGTAVNALAGFVTPPITQKTQPQPTMQGIPMQETGIFLPNKINTRI